MARAYSQDLRERVIKTALGGVSVRQAAATVQKNRPRLRARPARRQTRTRGLV